MIYVYAQVALDLANERTREAMTLARNRRLIASATAAAPTRSRIAPLARLRAGIARGAAALSVGSADLARRIDDCAASEILAGGASSHAA